MNLSRPKFSKEVCDIIENYGKNKRFIDPIITYLETMDFTTIGLPLVDYNDLCEEATMSEGVIAAAQKMLLKKNLTHDDEIALKSLVYCANKSVVARDCYTNKFEIDPFFNDLQLASGMMGDFPIEFSEHYLRVVKDVVRYIKNVVKKTKMQAQKGVILPKKYAEKAILVYENMIGNFVREDMREALGECSKELDRFYKSIDEELSVLVKYLKEEYVPLSKESVGMYNYENGALYYERCLVNQSGFDVSPEQVFNMGMKLRKDLLNSQAKIRAELGFEGSNADFIQHILTDKKYKEYQFKTAEEFGANLNSIFDEAKIETAKIMPIMPKGDCLVERMSPSLELHYEFGIFFGAKDKDDVGKYLYNGLNIESKNTTKNAALMCHECYPGHHWHLQYTAERDDIPALFKSLTCVGYGEGWGEYASGLGYEMGMFKNPIDVYGRMALDLYMIDYLILGPAINCNLMPFDDLLTLLREDYPEFDDERYALQMMRGAYAMPGFFESYKLGEIKFWELRKYAEEKLEGKFDVKEFHGELHRYGTIPHSILEDHIKYYVENKLR